MPPKAMFLLLYLNLLHHTCGTVKIFATVTEKLSATAPSKRNLKRSVSFPPVTHSTNGGQSDSYVPMFILRPISDEKARSMLSPPPYPSKSFSSSGWSGGMSGKTRYTKVFKSMF